MAWKSFRARKLPADQPLLHSPCWAAHHVQEVVCAEQIYPNTLLGKGRNPSLLFHAWEITALSWGSAVTKSTQQNFLPDSPGKILTSCSVYNPQHSPNEQTHTKRYPAGQQTWTFFIQVNSTVGEFTWKPGKRFSYMLRTWQTENNKVHFRPN